jgi:flagellar hook-basal body complex protein FliE
MQALSGTTPAAGQLLQSAGAPAAATGTTTAGANFTQTLTDAIGSLAGLQQNADTAIAGVATGQGTDIHQAMIAMQQASLGMHLATEVRDKAVEAYQSLINMQV